MGLEPGTSHKPSPSLYHLSQASRAYLYIYIILFIYLCYCNQKSPSVARSYIGTPVVYHLLHKTTGYKQWTKCAFYIIPPFPPIEVPWICPPSATSRIKKFITLITETNTQGESRFCYLSSQNSVRIYSRKILIFFYCTSK